VTAIAWVHSNAIARSNATRQSPDWPDLTCYRAAVDGSMSKESGATGMAAIAFDTLKFARRLKEAGVPEAQAEAQAELMAEASLLNMDDLKLQAKQIDDRLNDHNLRFNQIDDRLNDHDLRFNQIDLTLLEIRGDLKLQRWMLALIVITTVVPVLQHWFTDYVL
jgi:hypothetical protein